MMASENEWHVQRETALDLILEATLRPDVWNDFIAHVCKTVGASSGSIAIRSSQPALELIDPVAATWPDEAVEAYLTYPREADPVAIDLTLSVFAMRNGRSFILQELLDDQAYRRTSFFHDFANKFDLSYMAGVSMDVGADHFGTLMLYRQDGSPNFSQHERRFLESLVKPVQIGLETRRRLKGTMAAHGVLSRLAIPVVTLDERGGVDYVNQAAERLLQQGDIVSISRGRIRTSTPDTTKVLQAMCHDAVRGDIPRQGNELYLEHAGDTPPLRLSILPLSHRLSDSLWGGDVPAAIFFFDAQEDIPSPDMSTHLRKLYGCTETEAKIAVPYAYGETQPQVAKRFKISTETVRTHLKKVFRKTGVENKAELVKLIHSLGSPLR